MSIVLQQNTNGIYTYFQYLPLIRWLFHSSQIVTFCYNLHSTLIVHIPILPFSINPKNTLHRHPGHILNANFPYPKSPTTTYCLLCRCFYHILQPSYSEICHQETIAIALLQLVFTVISKFCCLWWLIYMPFGNSKSRKQGIHHFWKGLCARRYLCLVFQRH